MHHLARLGSLRAAAAVLVGSAMWLAVSWPASAADPSYSTRTLEAKRLAEPPIIDGDISDPIWQQAAVGHSFSDNRTDALVEDQTRFWLGYDATAIYLAFHCFDPEPDKLVMQETKRDGNIWGDDHVSFDFDPFHTHSWDDFSAFRVTPRGTQESEISGGRSGKTEWKGDWQAAARVVEDGWTAEMAIPWNILSYPSGDEPRTLGFNVARNHARRKYSSFFSNLGSAWRTQYAGNWAGVELPEGGFSPELLLLPFGAAGAAERDEEWEGTARGGIDMRYRPTPMLTGVLTFNPDFRNVQGEVEGIDFSRGERFVSETRPFFQEGNNTFDVRSGLVRYFYSRRIENVDIGAKVYGKLAKRTKVGMLGAFDFADQFEDRGPWELHRHDYVASLSQGFGEVASASVTGVWRRGDEVRNSVMGYRVGGSLLEQKLGITARYGSSRFNGIDEDEGDDDEDNENEGETPSQEPVTLSGDLGTLSVGWWDGRFWMDANLRFLSPGFRARNGFIEYPGRRGAGFYGGYWNEWRDRYFTEGGIDLWARYEERYDKGAGYEDIDGLIKRAFSTLGDRDTNERFFNDNAGYWTGIGTRSNLWFSHSLNVGHWRDEDSTTSDLDWSTRFVVDAHSQDRSRRVRVQYSFGRADGTFRNFTSFGASWKRDSVSLDYGGSILRHQDRRHQHILGVNVDLSTTMTIGGRIVFEYDEVETKSQWNQYVSFRRSGEAGIESFFILGDPSGEKFVPRIEGKVLFPL